jgi:photosystem II stability/assembly factor-like uncharacterized protein
MDDDDIRHALHTTYTTAGTKPTFVPEAFKEHAARPRRGPMVTSLVAVVAAVVVAVPIGVGVLLRSGVHGTTSVSNLSVLDLHMYGAKDGWAWSGGDNVLHTTSGVGHWTIVPPPIGTELITGLAFAGPDSARVLAVPADWDNPLSRSDTLTPWATDDGGATWTRGQPFRALLEGNADPRPPSALGYPDLDFVDPMHGWFFDSPGLLTGLPTFIYRTVDGGAHWSQVEMTPGTGTAAKGSLPLGCIMNVLTFANSTTGWVAGSCGHATLFDVTHDGGFTWAPEAFPCTNCVLFSLQFISPGDGQVSGSGIPGLWLTTDAGRTWNAVDIRRPSSPDGTSGVPPGAPYFIDSKHAVALGLTRLVPTSVTLWTTTDGGMTWAEAPDGAIHGNGPSLNSSLDFVTPEMGWAESYCAGAVGQTPCLSPPPTLWQTTDAGSTWTKITPTFSSSK